MKDKVVCVVNNYDTFDKVVKSNEHLKDCEIHYYDNSIENISVTERYNDFIDELPEDEDFWVMFIHQDFGFLENPIETLRTLNPKYIYGTIGVKFYKFLYFNRHGFKRHHVAVCGKILQGNNDFNFREYGVELKRPKTATSVDCCCIMIHSSLIKKHSLRFDENLKFHMYAEDLCYRARKKYKIKVKVVQMKCFHMGIGSLDEEFKASADYLKQKFKISRIPSTCPN